jgi:mRNA-degrading endonuclease toxin of MazEF toxin-antitoxin module
VSEGGFPRLLAILTAAMSLRRSTAGGLREVSYITCEFIRSLSPLRFERRLGHVDAVVMAKTDAILRRLLFD